MSKVITVLLILVTIISINGVLNYIALNNAEAASDSQNITIIDSQTRVKSADGNIAGEGGGDAPFSLYPLNLKDVNNFYAVYKPDTFPEELSDALSKQFNNFAYEILGRLAACYGTLYYYLEKQTVVPDYITFNNRYLTNLSETLLSEYINYKAVQNIMYAAYTNMGENYQGWLWGDFFDNKDYNTWWEFNGTNAITFIQNSAGEADEANRLYCTIMECNLYEVLLDEKITVYPATRNELEKRINTLKARYKQNTEYLGFSKMDAIAITNYILKHVIGISTKNGIAIYNLIKQIVEAQIIEAVSAKRHSQLSNNGFLVKSLLNIKVYGGEDTIPLYILSNDIQYTLKHAVINPSYARSFNGLPLVDNNEYKINIVDNGSWKEPLISKKYYYNKWFYISPGFNAKPINISDFEDYKKGVFSPKGDCIILTPQNQAIRLFRTY